MDLRQKGVQPCLLHADFDKSPVLLATRKLIYAVNIYICLCTIYISLKLHIYAYKSYIIDANTYLDKLFLEFYLLFGFLRQSLTL